MRCVREAGQSRRRHDKSYVPFSLPHIPQRQYLQGVSRPLIRPRDASADQRAGGVVLVAGEDHLPAAAGENCTGGALSEIGRHPHRRKGNIFVARLSFIRFRSGQPLVELIVERGDY